MQEEVSIYETPTEFSWVVYSDYEITNGLIRPVTTTEIKRKYNPLEVPNLFQQFAYLLNDIDLSVEESEDLCMVEKRNAKCKKAVLEWVKKYGLLHNTEASADPYVIEDMVKKTTTEYYIKKIFEARQAVDHYQAFLDTISDGCSDYAGLKFAYQDTFNLFLLKDGPLSNIRLGVKLEGNPPTFHPVYIPDDLLSAIWLQFWQNISNQAKLRFCEWCGRPFFFTHKRQKYCPGDELSDYKSICARNHAQWLHREKSRAFELFDQGMTVRDVSAVLSKEKRPIEEMKVTEWQQEWNNSKRNAPSSRLKR